MRTHNLIFILSILTFTLGCSQKPFVPKTDLENSKLKGKVKIITFKEYIVGTKGEIKDSLLWNNIDSLPDKKIFYNETGNLEKEIQYNGLIWYIGKTIYTYNDLNQLIQIEFKSDDQKSHGLTTYKYNKSGYLIESIQSYDSELDGEKNSSNTITKYTKYDQSGHLLKEIHEDGNGDNNYYCIFTYDSKSAKVKSQEFSSKTKEIMTTAIYTYDKNGNETNSQMTRHDNSAVFKGRFYTYDDFGNILTESYETPGFDKPEMRVLKYTYTFDSIGNWIQKTESDDKGMRTIIKRKIEYW